MKRPCLPLAWVLLAVQAATAETDLPVASGPVVSLPPMLVEGLGSKGPHWRYAAFPGFEVLSCASDEATEDFALRLYRLDAHLRAVVPPNLLFRTDQPVTLIFYPQSRAESLSKEFMAEIERAQIRDRSNQFRAPPNLDLRDPDSSVLFSIIDDRAHGWARFGLDASDYHNLALSPEHVINLVEDRAPSPPPWFTVGFARFYNSMWTGEDGLHFSADNWLGRNEADAVRDRPDALRATLPLADLLTGRLPRAGSTAAGRSRQRLWAAEAELFVRWCLDGKRVPTGSARDALWQLVDAASRQPLTEALVRRCFGLGFSDLRDELSDYLASATDHPLIIPLAGLPPEPSIKMADPSPEVIHRIKGDWARRTLRLVHDSYPALLPLYIKQARDPLQKGYDEGEHSPALVAELGLLYVDLGEAATARRYLEEAFRPGTMPAYALAQLAYLRLQDAKQHPAGPSGRLSRDQIETVLAPVRAARKLQPPQLLTYSVVAELCRNGPSPSSAEVRADLTEGAVLFPSISSLVLNAGFQEAAAGHAARALQVLEMGMWVTADPGAFAQLNSMRNALRPKGD